MLARLVRSFFVLVYCLALGSPAAATAAPPPSLEITELLPDPASPQTDADDEFIELFNPSSSAVNLSGYLIKSSSKLGASHTLGDYVVPAGGFLTLMSRDTKIQLANAGSSVALFDPAQQPVGRTITYKTAPTGSAWARQPDGGWSWTKTPTPDEVNQFTASGSISAKAPTPAIPDEGAEVLAVATNSRLQLTELLPDPAAPQTDAANEFIELYNPTDAPVNVTGYVIKTGTSLKTKHSLPAAVVPAFGYLALHSGATKIQLANAGSSVALFDPSGAPVGPTITYAAAKTGVAWALGDTGWEWTSTPTPGGANVLSAPVSAASSGTSKSAATKAVRSSKSTKTTTTKAPKAVKASATVPAQPVAHTTPPDANWLLFALAGLTITYCLYEFRYDLQRFYHRIRGHAGSRAAISHSPEGR
jgi:hypothetical protein